MARGSQFGQLKTMLRNEIGRSNTAGSSGVADFNQLGQLINKHYELLYADYDWPHLIVNFDRIPLQAGERYYDFPTTLDYDRVIEAKVWVDELPQDLTRGITFEDYAGYSSEDDIRADPALKWDVRYTGTTEQMEIWPIPADGTDSFVQFRGITKFTRLIADADLCRLDDMLVIAYAAAELAMGQGDTDAQAKLATANRLYDRLRGRSKGPAKTYTFNGGADSPPWPPRNTTVVISH